MTTRLKRFLAGVLAALLIPAIALAQVQFDTPEEQLAAARTLYDLIVTKSWWPAAGIVVMFLCLGLRKLGPRVHPKLGVFLEHPLVKFALPWVVSIMLAFVNAFLAGGALQAALYAALLAAMTAIIAYVGSKQVAEARALGKVAGAAVKTDADAVAVYNQKGPEA